MASKLDKYQRMRDFDATPEPPGRSAKKQKSRLIFVVQKHHASHLHYDFRLEMEGVLKSWAVPKGPSFDPNTKRLAMMTEDHPYDYAGFEGVIPEGNYGAGNVIIWDEGTWEFLEPGDDPVAALGKGKLTFVLRGKKLKGEWALVKIRGRGQGEKGNEWLLLKHRDQYADERSDITGEKPLSVRSKKDVEDLGGEKQWISNRAAVPKRLPTIADALRKKAADAARPKKASSSSSAAAGSKKGRSSGAPSTKKSAAATSRKSQRATGKK